MITVLAGGIGAGRFLQGLVQVVAPREVTIISNVGDDLEMFGLHISPDIDIVTYHLTGFADEERGWGLKDDTFHALEALGRLGQPTWFHIGDRDLALHLRRTQLLREGRTLSQATAEIVRALGLEVTILPMTNDHFRTKVATEAGLLSYQDYLVKRQAQDRVQGVRYPGVRGAKPAPGVLEAIQSAEGVVLAPSNPVASIGPILAVEGIRAALHQTKAPVLAVSPIVGGRALLGAADRILGGMGLEVSAYGVAQLYEDFLDCMIIDEADAELRGKIEARGLQVFVTNTIMHGISEKIALARQVLAAMGR